MRDPEMYNHVRQVLESMRDHGIGLRHALGMHGHNMTEHEVRQVIAERRDLQTLSEEVLGPGYESPGGRAARFIWENGDLTFIEEDEQ